MNFTNLECLYVLIVQYGECKRKVIAGETIYLHLVADTYKNLRECVKRFRRDLRNLDRKHGPGKFALYRRLEQLIKTPGEERWDDCIPLLEAMAIHHPDGDEPVEVKVSDR